MIKRKVDLIKHMMAHPEERLELCSGVRDHHWAWLRVPGASDTTMVNRGIAWAARESGLLVRDPPEVKHHDPEYYKLKEEVRALGLGAPIVANLNAAGLKRVLEANR